MFAYWRKKRSNIFAVSAGVGRRKGGIGRRVWLRPRLAWLWLAIVVLILFGFIYLIVWSPVFKIKKWSVEGVNFMATAQARETVDQFLQTKIWRVIPSDSLAVFSSQKMIHRILANFSEAESVQISKDILKGVKIIIKGRQPTAIWCKSMAIAPSANQATSTAGIILPASERCFFTDREGLLFREAPEISGTAMPKIFGRPEENFAFGDKAMASSTVQFIVDLKKQLRDIGVETLGFTVGAADGADLIVYTGEGWQVYFNATHLSQPQVKILAALLAGDLKDKTAGLKYVDLRMAGKIYYK